MTEDPPPLLCVFGSNTHGQLGYRGSRHTTIPRRILFNNVRDVHCSSTRTFLITTNGEVWGTTKDGKFKEIIGNSKVVKMTSHHGMLFSIDDEGKLYSMVESWNEITPKNTTIKTMSSGALFSAFLGNDHIVYLVGDVPDCGNSKSPNQIQKITIPEPVISVSCGAAFIMCLTSTGKIIAWGSNKEHQLSLTDGSVGALLPTPIIIADPVIPPSSILCGDTFSLLIFPDGTIKQYGNNTSEKTVTVPSGCRTAAVGSRHVIVESREGVIYSFGCNEKGQLGRHHNSELTSNNTIALCDDHKITLPASTLRPAMLRAGWEHSAVLTYPDNPLSADVNLQPLSISDLPMDVILSVIGSLDFYTQCSLSVVSKQLAIASRDDSIWKNRSYKIKPWKDCDPGDHFLRYISNKKPDCETTFFSNLKKSFKSSKPNYKIILLGLDASGKSSILARLHGGENALYYVRHTIGFDVKTINKNNTDMTIWDLNGADKTRPLWKHYYPNVDAIILVIDLGDRERLSDVIEFPFFFDPSLVSKPLLIYANKNDIDSAMSESDLTKSFSNLSQHHVMRKRQWKVQHCSAMTGVGIEEGIQWLTTKL